MTENFHCVIHPVEVLPRAKGDPIELHTVKVEPLGQINGQQFNLSFEEAAERLEAIPRLYLEPDGTFVWAIEAEKSFQLDGLMIDNGNRLLAVELKGCCGTTEFEQFLRVLGWPAQQLVFELVRAGIYVDESDFRKLFIR